MPTRKSDSGSARSASFSKKMATMMRLPLLAVRVAVACGIGCSPAYAATYQWPYDGKAPLPPSLSDQTAQPECGFAATASWGPNGFQWCDPKNVYPSPDFSHYLGASGRRISESRCDAATLARFEERPDADRV